MGRHQEGPHHHPGFHPGNSRAYEVSRLRAYRFYLGAARTAVGEPVAGHRASCGSPPASGEPTRLYYLTQAGVAPPIFVAFTNRSGKLHFSFERFLENRIRERFGFLGTPIVIKSRARR